ncbi:MAG: hypothetical protein EBS30_10975 [Planctomycetes bacterium]|nr:hypothetical protein [Planctomycetota bacterium]
MAYLRPYRVAEMSTTTGTGSIAVAGAVTGYLAFLAELANGDTVTIVIEAVDSSGQPTGAWEICDSTFTSPATLTRGTIRDSSAGGSRINFSVGNKRVFSINPRDAVNLSSSDVTGTLSVANGGTGASTSTGTGSVVCSNSPTLVTPTLGVASATSTANGLGAVAAPSYTFTGNLDTGIWSPSANIIAFSTTGIEAIRVTPGVFDQETGGETPGELQVSGQARFGGTVGTFVGSTGIRVGPDRGSSAGDAFVVFFTSGNTGVYDSILTRGGGSNTDLNLVNRGTGNIAITAENAGAVVVKTDNQERMRVASNGNVGIGTTAPAVNLEVSSAFNVSAENPAPTEARISTTTVSSSYPTDKPWGRLSFYSFDTSDGGAKVQGAIDAIADSSNGGRMAMVFSTTTAGGNILTERMRLSANGNVAIITNQTTGGFQVGGPSGTGTMTLGQSTVSQTTNIQAGVTASGSTKTINLGTGAASGATSTITIGSATSGATQTTTINGRVTLAPIGASAEAWTTSGIALTQSAATFTDTSSSGTVADIRINNFAAQTLAASSATTVTRLFGTYFVDPVAGTNVTATDRFALGADSLRVAGSATFGSTLTITGGGNTIGLASSQTSGAILIGGTSATATITLGRSTGNQTTLIQAGATASGSTKTINIGTGGLTGSTTAITIGSTFGTSITFNAPVRLAGFTVATLPAAGTAGRRAYVTDALAPMFLVAVAAGGSVVCPVFDNGTSWVAG